MISRIARRTSPSKSNPDATKYHSRLSLSRLTPPPDCPDDSEKYEEVEVGQDQEDGPVIMRILVDSGFQEEEEEGHLALLRSSISRPSLTQSLSSSSAF